MPKVVVTAQVQDPVQVGEGRSDARGASSGVRPITKPINFATIAGNHDRGLRWSPADLDTFMKGLDSPATAEAMAFDGVKRETVRVFVLDKEFKV